MCLRRGLFGEQAGLERVRQELLGYSDFQLHRFAAAHAKRFAGFMLPPACLRDSGKCLLLAALLPQLQARCPCSQRFVLIREERLLHRCHSPTLAAVTACSLPGSILRPHASCMRCRQSCRAAFALLHC